MEVNYRVRTIRSGMSPALMVAAMGLSAFTAAAIPYAKALISPPPLEISHPERTSDADALSVVRKANLLMELRIARYPHHKNVPASPATVVAKLTKAPEALKIVTLADGRLFQPGENGKLGTVIKSNDPEATNDLQSQSQAGSRAPASVQ